MAWITWLDEVGRAEATGAGTTLNVTLTEAIPRSTPVKGHLLLILAHGCCIGAPEGATLVSITDNAPQVPPYGTMYGGANRYTHLPCGIPRRCTARDRSVLVHRPGTASSCIRSPLARCSR